MDDKIKIDKIHLTKKILTQRATDVAKCIYLCSIIFSSTLQSSIRNISKP